MKRNIGRLVAAVIVTLLWASPAMAASAGALDTSFDGDGAVVADVFGEGNDYGSAMAVQPDGKIVVAGTWALSGGYSNFAVMRFNSNGSVDKDFGSGGRTLTDFDNDHDSAFGVAIAPDGKIVVVGNAYTGGPVRNKNIAIARYEADGDRDPTFSGDGKVWYDIGGHDEANDVAVQRDGKIVVVGMRYDNSDSSQDFYAVRLTTSGAKDTTFSSDGLSWAMFGEEREGANSVAIQPSDNRIVVAGWAWDDGDTDFALARFRTDGTLDSTFDGNGTLLTGFGEDESAADVAIAPDGKIVAGGRKESDFAAARYLRSGAPDTTFDGDGRRSYNLGGSESVGGVAVQLDGKIVLAGSHSTQGTFYGDVAVVRVKTSGALDTSFAGDGIKTQGISAGDTGNDVAIQRSDGKIVVGGTTKYATGGTDDTDLALLRLWESSS